MAVHGWSAIGVGIIIVVVPRFITRMNERTSRMMRVRPVRSPDWERRARRVVMNLFTLLGLWTIVVGLAQLL